MSRPSPLGVLQRPLTPDTVLTVSEAMVALQVPEAERAAYRLWLSRVVRRMGPKGLERVRWGDVLVLDAEVPQEAQAGLAGYIPGAGLRRGTRQVHVTTRQAVRGRPDK